MGKAPGYKTDRVSTFMGLTFWSGKTDNKPINKYTS